MASFCTVGILWISNNDETEYRNETENLVNWCSNNNLSLNVNKAKEIVINFRKHSGEHVPVYINGNKVEINGQELQVFRCSDHQQPALVPPCQHNS